MDPCVKVLTSYLRGDEIRTRSAQSLNLEIFYLSAQTNETDSIFYTFLLSIFSSEHIYRSAVVL